MNYEQIKGLLDAGFTAPEIRTFCSMESPSTGAEQQTQSETVSAENPQVSGETSNAQVNNAPDMAAQLKSVLDNFVSELRLANANSASRGNTSENSTESVTAKIMKGV